MKLLRELQFSIHRKMIGADKHAAIEQAIDLKDRRNPEEKVVSDKTVQENEKFTSSMLDLIYNRTGMRFLSEADGGSYLLPGNLRDMISWILMWRKKIRIEFILTIL